MIRKWINEQSVHSLIEALFISVVGLYIVFLVQGTTTFYLELPDLFEKRLYLLCAGLAIVKCGTLLCEKPEERIHNLCLMAGASIITLVYLLVHHKDQYMFLKFLGVLTLGMVGTDYRKVVKLYVCVVGTVVAAAIVGALGGIITNLVYPSAGRIRSAWGIVFPTDYASYFVYLCVAAWVAWKKVPNWVFALLGGISFLNAFYIAKSRTSMICSVLFILVILGWYLMRYVSNRGREHDNAKLVAGLTTVKKAFSWLVSLAFPIFGVFVLFLTFCYAKGMSFAYGFDTLFSGRLALAGNAYREYGLSLFGTPFDMIGAGTTTFAQTGYNFVDSTYPLIMLRYGMVLLVVIAVLWTLMSRKAIKMGDWRLALGLAIIAFHSISEHHFVEINYNIFLALPFAVLGAQSLPADKYQRKHVRELLPGAGRMRLMTGTITAVMLTVIAFLFGPLLLQLMRTAWGVIVEVEIPKKAHLAFVALVCGVMAAVALAYACYGLLCAALERRAPQKYLFVAGAAGIAVVAAAFVGCNIVIERYESHYLSAVKADETAVQTVKSACQESGGMLYSSVVPQLYQRTYGGFGSSFFTGDDLARFRNVSVIMDANYESACFFSRGFLYTQISDEHALYTDDADVIAKLGAAGYHLTGYFSKERSVDLAEEARLNNLPIADDGALVLNGGGQSLIFGPYLELRGGAYTITYELSVPEDGYVAGTDADYELGYLRISSEWGQNIIKKVPIMRSQFSDSFTYTAKVECGLGEIRGVEFLAFMNDGMQMQVHSITYQKTPEYDTHTTFDSHNRKIHEEYFDLEGQPYQMKDGYSACNFAYDGAGNVNLVTYLDANGQPVMTAKGYAQLGQTYDNRKLVTREDYLDERGKPIMLVGGYASAEHKYDRAKNRIETRYFGIDGQPIMLPANYHIVRKEFDAERRVTRESYYDTADQPVMIKGGYAAVERDYDDAGNEIAQRLYDEAGNLVLNSSGWAEIHRAYDGEKHVIREEYYGVDGKPIVLKAGQAAAEFAYDTAGNRTDTYYLDAENNPTLVWNAYAGVHNDFNEKRQAVREWYYGLDGKMMTRAEGYSIVDRTFDEDGNASVFVYADAEGKPVMRTDGFAELHRTYNEKRQVVRDEYCDTDGNPCAHKNGCYAVEYAYDAAGNTIEQRFLDQGGNLVNNTSGYAVEQKEFDALGNATKTMRYTKDMQPVA